MGFDATILWIIVVGVAMLGTGLYAGYALRGRDAVAREAQLQSEIGSVRDSFDEHKRRVTKHFERSSDLFRDLTRHYAALYTHLSQGARDFCKGSSPSLGAELKLLLADGEQDASAAVSVANDFRAGRQILGQPPGAPVPLHARHTSEVSWAQPNSSGSATGASARTMTETRSGQPRNPESAQPEAGDGAETVEVVAADAQPASGARPARPREGIGEWLARLDAREREREQSFSSGYQRTHQTDVGIGSRAGAEVAPDAAMDQPEAGARAGAGNEPERAPADEWDGRDLVDQKPRRGRKRGLRAA